MSLIFFPDGEHYLALEEEFGVFQSSENKSLIIPCKPTLPNISVTLENQEDDSVVCFLHVSYFHRTEYERKNESFCRHPLFFAPSKVKPSFIFF